MQQDFSLSTIKLLCFELLPNGVRRENGNHQTTYYRYSCDSQDYRVTVTFTANWRQTCPQSIWPRIFFRPYLFVMELTLLKTWVRTKKESEKNLYKTIKDWAGGKWGSGDGRKDAVLGNRGRTHKLFFHSLKKITEIMSYVKEKKAREK